MSLYTRLKIWTEGEILSAADLNTEFNNDLINGPPNHASQHAASAVDDIKAYYLSLSAGGTVAAAVTFSAAAPITLTSRLNEYKGSDIASAATTDIGAAGGNFVDVTGAVTITALGTIQAGTERIVRFTSTPTLTHNGTSLILPGGANIVCQANDIAMFRSLGAGNWVCTSYQRAVAPPAGATTVYDGTAYRSASPTPAANTVPVRDANKQLTDADNSVIRSNNLVVKSSDEAVTTSFADVAGLSFSIAANTNYYFEFNVPASGPGSSSAFYLSVNGPASPTYLSYQTLFSGGGGYVDSAISYDASTGKGNYSTETFAHETLRGIIRNGTNAGTLALRAKYITALWTIKQGATGTLTKLP